MQAFFTKIYKNLYSFICFIMRILILYLFVFYKVRFYDISTQTNMDIVKISIFVINIIFKVIKISIIINYA